jgi:signal transduction histidine kinase
MRRRMSLEQKLPLLMSGIFILVFAVSLYATFQSLSRAATETARGALVRATQQIAKLAEAGVASGRPRFRTAADDPTVRQTLARAMASKDFSPVRGDTTIPGSVGAVLAHLRTPADSGLPIELWTADRRLAAYVGDGASSVPEAAASTLAPSPELPFLGLENIPAVDSMKIGRLFVANGRASYWSVLPIIDSGKLVGYIAKEGRIAVNPQTDKSLRALAGEAVSMYYRNDDGTVWTTLSGHVVDAPERREQPGILRRAGVGRLLSNEERVNGTPLVIAMEIPVTQVLAGTRAIVRSLALLSLVLLAAGTTATWLIARRVARPLRGITIAAEAVARGDYQTRVPSVGEDETVRLAEAFNHMASEIAEGHSALEQQTLEAQAANKAKSDFLATMSHELRTPLNAIGGYVGLIDMGLRGPVSDDQRRDLQRVRAAQQHLLGLISGMLDLGRIETGRVTYDLAPVPLDEFLGTLDALIAPQALAKSIALAYQPTDPSLAVLADSEKLRQVMLNLLSNAIRHTPSGGSITLDADALSDTAVVIHVRDTGPGIPRDKHEQIFEPFVQLDRSLAQPHEGVGLGLAISRDLARGMGGELTVDSELSEGAQFSVVLPRAFLSS